MKYLAGCRVQEFYELARLCRSDPTFPTTREEWDRLVTLAERAAASEGLVVCDLTLDLDTFDHWCEVVGIVPCLDALRAFMIVTRTKLEMSSRDLP